MDIRTAGERLARMLIDRIRGTKPEALRETALARFIDRGSIGHPEFGTDGPARRLGTRRSTNH